MHFCLCCLTYCGSGNQTYRAYRADPMSRLSLQGGQGVVTPGDGFIWLSEDYRRLDESSKSAEGLEWYMTW